MTVPIAVDRRDLYVATAPDGAEITIPKELFVVLCDFIEGHKQMGTVIIHFRNGGVAGLETMIKKTYK